MNCSSCSEPYGHADDCVYTYIESASIKKAETPQADAVNNPSHYADSYPFEVYEAIKHILNTHCEGLTPYEIWQYGQELKYRFRAGLKDDGHNGAQDIAKAMRCRQMRGE